MARATREAGLGRCLSFVADGFLPRQAERDFFHPSLEDLRADGLTGVRLQLAIAALWIECWRVWATGSRRLHRDAAGRRGPSTKSPHRRELAALLFQDVRRAFRQFRTEPGFATAAVLTLALGIGANTALFAVIEAVLLRPLPVSGADQIVIVRHRDLNTGLTKEHLALGDVVDLRARIQTLEALALYGGTTSTLYGDGEPMRLEGLTATPELLSALRVRVSLGRLLTAGDGRQGAPRTVLISHDLWETRVGSDPNIVGRGIQLGSARAQVVGVIERGFHFPPDSPTHIILPFPQQMIATPPAQRAGGWIFGLGRMKPGVTIDAVRAELETLAIEFEWHYPEQNRGTRYHPELLYDAIVGDTKRPLLLL